MTTTTTNLEARAIGREMAQSRQDMTDYLQTEYHLDDEEARAKTLELARAETTAQLMERPPKNLSWFDLDQLAEQDTALAIQAWDDIKAEVREEHQNGHQAARALEAFDASPRERAEFLVLREEFSEQHRPRNGIERSLVDMLAQTHTSYLFWLERLTAYTHLEPKAQAVKDEGRWSPPRVEHSKAVDDAAGMVDRFHRMFTRTLKSLRDQRRYSPTLIVQHAQQVNLAEQQCNITAEQADLLPS
jgi:hypothetical protein